METQDLKAQTLNPLGSLLFRALRSALLAAPLWFRSNPQQVSALMGDKDNRAGSQHACSKQMSWLLGGTAKVGAAAPSRAHLSASLLSLLIPNLCFLPLYCCCFSTSEFTKPTHFHAGLPPVEDTRIMPSCTQSLATSCLSSDLRLLSTCYKASREIHIQRGQQDEGHTNNLFVCSCLSKLGMLAPVFEPEATGNSDSQATFRTH